MFPATVKVKDEFKQHGEKLNEIRHEILKENHEILVNDYESLKQRFEDIEDTNKITRLQLEKRTRDLEESYKKIVEEMKRSETETKAGINDLMTKNKELVIEKAKEKEEFENKIDQLEKKLDMIESKYSSMKTFHDAKLVSDSTSYGDKSVSNEAMEHDVEHKSSINDIVISDGNEAEDDNFFRAMNRKRQRFGDRNQEQPRKTTVLPRNSVEQVLRYPGQIILPKLHPKHLPGTIWFDTDSSIVRQITKIICADFKEPHANWSQTTYEIRKRWFIAFGEKYSWKGEVAGLVQKKFNQYAASRVKGQVSTWRTAWKKKGDNAKPRLMTDIVWTGLVKYWTHPKSIQKSVIASRSRLSAPRSLGPHKHTSGSKSFHRVRKEMELETCETPSILKFLEMTHKSNGDGGQAKQIHEVINDKITKKSQELTQAEIDKSVTPRRGRTYGLGSIMDGVGSSSGRTFDFSSWKDRTDPKTKGRN